jgi:hypothetical protein
MIDLISVPIFGSVRCHPRCLSSLPSWPMASGCLAPIRLVRCAVQQSCPRHAIPTDLGRPIVSGDGPRPFIRSSTLSAVWPPVRRDFPQGVDPYCRFHVEAPSAPIAALRPVMGIQYGREALRSRQHSGSRRRWSDTSRSRTQTQEFTSSPWRREPVRVACPRLRGAVRRARRAEDEEPHETTDPRIDDRGA